MYIIIYIYISKSRMLMNVINTNKNKLTTCFVKLDGGAMLCNG